MKRSLIFGSNGFLGQHLTAALMRRGVEVTGYGRSLPLSNQPQHFIQGDFARETRFPAILSDGNFDVVYHLISTTAPALGTVNALRDVEENLTPAIRLLDALRGTGTELVFSSSGGTVYGELADRPHRCDDPLRPICSYGMQKAALEGFMQLYSRAEEVRCKICRISNPYGVMPQHGRTQGIIPILLRSLLQGKPITLYGETVRDYIFISDVIAALLAVADYGGSETVFNVGTGIGVGLHELVHLLEARTRLTFTEVREEPIRACDVEKNVLDITDTTRLLDWTPEISLTDGIVQTLNALQEQDRS